MIVTLKRLSYVKESYCALQGIVHPLSSFFISNVFCISMAAYCPVHKRLLLRQKPFLFCSASLRIIETAFPEMMVIYHFEEKVICHFEKIIIYHMLSPTGTSCRLPTTKMTHISKLNIEQKIILNCIH